LRKSKEKRLKRILEIKKERERERERKESKSDGSKKGLILREN
jgi:hypothetical protein